jgi:hypothetical protein
LLAYGFLFFFGFFGFFGFFSFFSFFVFFFVFFGFLCFLSFFWVWLLLCMRLSTYLTTSWREWMDLDFCALPRCMSTGRINQWIPGAVRAPCVFNVFCC